MLDLNCYQIDNKQSLISQSKLNHITGSQTQYSSNSNNKALTTTTYIIEDKADNEYEYDYSDEDDDENDNEPAVHQVLSDTI